MAWNVETMLLSLTDREEVMAKCLRSCEMVGKEVVFSIWLVESVAI